MLKFRFKKILTAFIAICSLFSLWSCSGYLSVHTEYLTEESLASYYVNTPDPRRLCPFIGQRLIILWTVPREILFLNDLHLHIFLRYRNRETAEQMIPITRKSGSHYINVLDENYYNTRGILTYKIQLIGGGEVIEEWKHQIWSNIIELNATNTSEATNEELSIIDWDIND